MLYIIIYISGYLLSYYLLLKDAKSNLRIDESLIISTLLLSIFSWGIVSMHLSGILSDKFMTWQIEVWNK